MGSMNIQTRLLSKLWVQEAPMTEKLVSIVIPSFNHAAFIVEAIQSVLNQTYQNTEIIVVDDGSKDSSTNLIKDLILNYQGNKKIKLIEQPNLGAHKAIERGITDSNGEYIGILNSDDYFSENRVERLLQTMNDENADLVFSRVIHVDNEGVPLDLSNKMKHSYEEHKKLSDLYGDEFVLCGYNIAISTGNFLFKRSLHNKIGPFKDYKTVHDWAYILKALASSKVSVCNENLLFYRVHKSNTIGTGYDDSNDCRELLIEFFKIAHSQNRNIACPSELNFPVFFRFFLRKYFPAVCDIYEEFEKSMGSQEQAPHLSKERSLQKFVTALNKLT